jgi:DNA topoisomerase I
MVKKFTSADLRNTLVIVESPAKCAKIEEYLGSGYKCIASYGHLRELNSLKHIDENFVPTYTIIEKKCQQIDKIKKAILGANEIILALDGDREGEKIAYCIAQIFNLDIKTTKRITFNEITKMAIQYAIQNPRTIDMDLVNAQQARQIIDLLVGFKISPMLWSHFNAGASLSAGRCQTPALRLIYENYKEISQSNERKVYNTTGYFTSANLAFELQTSFENDDAVTDFLNDSIGFSHVYTCSKPKRGTRRQPDPFTTSTLQQASSNEMRLSPKETMRICQALYEGGYITYMRTDSKSYSRDFIECAKEYITREYDTNYINEQIDDLVSKCKDKEAHEAIRPTNISLIELNSTMDSKEQRLYKLIRENTLASCMSPAVFYSVTATITAAQNAKFTYTSEIIDFPGWTIAIAKSSKVSNEYQYLQQIKPNTVIPYKKMVSKMKFVGLKQHYTEARLVQLLEEHGIGRPSTFSSLVDKIQERGYVSKQNVEGRKVACKDFELTDDNIYEVEEMREFGAEKNKLVIQSLGILVMEFLDAHFSQLLNYEYTSGMENELDLIANGNGDWSSLCRKCDEQLTLCTDKLKDEPRMKIQLDETNAYIIGKHGPVIKNTELIDGKQVVNFKKIKQDVDVSKIHEYKVEDLLAEDVQKKRFNLGKYEGHDVILQKGKFGVYASWGKNTCSLKQVGNRPIESISFEEVEKYILEQENCGFFREISQDCSIRRSKKGDYIFFKTAKMKKPTFHSLDKFTEDYKICHVNILKSWIKETYGLNV